MSPIGAPCRLQAVPLGESAEVDLEHGREHAGGDEPDPSKGGADQDLDTHQTAFHAMQKLHHVGNLLRAGQGQGMTGRGIFRLYLCTTVPPG